jgi:hypothetical protein
MQNRSNTRCYSQKPSAWHVTTKGIRHQFRYWLIVLSTVLISYGVLTFEITLTRVFSVMLSYHYVFAIVSFALFGLGIGGLSLDDDSTRRAAWH